MDHQIPLTQGKVATVSDEDFARVSEHKWCLHRRAKRTDYAQANIKIDGTWKRVLLHRFILEAATGVQVDHENGDGLDCRRENLRLATHSNNMHNSVSRQGTSQFKGVCWHRTGRKWLVQITVNRKHHYLGLFTTEEEAARVYDAAAKELHGDFAKTNF